MHARTHTRGVHLQQCTLLAPEGRGQRGTLARWVALHQRHVGGLLRWQAALQRGGDLLDNLQAWVGAGMGVVVGAEI